MDTFNQSQLKLLSNFCADIAKGALLSGLGLAFILPENAAQKVLFTIPATTIGIFSLFFALQFAKLLRD